MKRVEVIIVAGDETFCCALTEAVNRLSEMFPAFGTDSERCALEYMQMHPVDILFLEMELAEGDGRSLLEQLSQQELPRPLIIGVTDSGSPTMARYMREHGVDYICRKGAGDDLPRHLLDLALRLYPYKCAFDRADHGYMYGKLTGEPSDVVTRRYIERELMRMGFRRKYVGFAYIAEAIELLIHWEPDRQVQITREIYPLVAGHYHVTKQSVERAIRSAIKAAFAGIPDRELHRYYPYPFDHAMGRPSNVDFLVNMSMRLMLE